MFIIPGVHNMPLWWALGEAGIDRVLVRHEQTAMYAADGYFRATGKLGVCITTSGPGAANTAGATGEALTSGSAVLHISTTPHLSLKSSQPGVRRGSLHEIPDQASIFTALVKSVSVVERAGHAGTQVRIAIKDALRPQAGPVYVELPTDLLGAVVPEDSIAASEYVPVKPRLRLPEAAVEALSSSRKPIIWAGAGSIGARVADLAEHLAAPVVSTMMARSTMDARNPLAVVAPPQEQAVADLLNSADLVIALGTDFDGQTTQNWRLSISPPLLRVDVDETQLTLNAIPDFPVRATVSSFIESVLEVIPPASDERRASAEAAAKATSAAIANRLREDGEEAAAANVVAALNRTLPSHVPVVADMTLMGYWASGYLERSQPRTFMFPMGWGTLGFALPASVGVAHGSGQPTVVVVGDAGFLFAVGDLASLVERNLPVKVIVFNDEAYKMLEQGVPADRSREGLTGLCTPDFVTLAQAFGMRSQRATLETLGTAIEAELLLPGPALIEVPNVTKPPVTTSARWPLAGDRVRQTVHP
ncbi:thiamine pyrophosphate-binding protein [Microbacterium soli]|uniref:Thiamine pyrophosphate-binding protein n=1 Tax=Microbacterium soli TaxID=446075 RepID=A0ABP7MYW7_9MICO